MWRIGVGGSDPAADVTGLPDPFKGRRDGLATLREVVESDLDVENDPPWLCGSDPRPSSDVFPFFEVLSLIPEGLD